MTSEFKIEKGIPIPKVEGNVGRKAKYPWDQMEVGDSFFVPWAKNNFSVTHTRNGKADGKRFVSRKTVVDGVRGYRVWRTE